MEERPTLEDQIVISKLTDEECIKLIVPHGGLRGLDFFIFRHTEWLWHIMHWNWFNPCNPKRKWWEKPYRKWE